MKSKRAVLILEGPWNMDKHDANRSSVLPFFEGMAKQFHDVEVIYSRYYDLSSFRLALTEITAPEFKSSIIYIAGHGDGKKVSGANIKKVFEECRLASSRVNATGVIIGSCFSAGTDKSPLDNEIISMIHDSNISWAAAYNCASYWFASTMIDCALIRRMLMANEQILSQKESITSELAEAISPFSRTYEIGTTSSDLDDEGDPVQLCDGLVFFAQSAGQGHRAHEITSQVWDEWENLQLEEVDQSDE